MVVSPLDLACFSPSFVQKLFFVWKIRESGGVWEMGSERVNSRSE